MRKYVYIIAVDMDSGETRVARVTKADAQRADVKWYNTYAEAYSKIPLKSEPTKEIKQ